LKNWKINEKRKFGFFWEKDGFLAKDIVELFWENK
jgi:hypothetical protein